jgi:hypothetical protein
MLRAWIDDCQCDEERQAKAALACFRFCKDYLLSAVVKCCLDDASRHRELEGHKKRKRKNRF